MSRSSSYKNSRKLHLEHLENRELLSINTLPVPAYSSLPESSYTIFIDFNGHNENTKLQAGSGKPAAFDLDGNNDAFSDLERKAIHDIWAYVAEIYSPFSVNVTTVDPGTAALVKSNKNDTEYGIRICFGPIDGGSIGLAWTGTFDSDYESVDAMVDSDKIYKSTQANWNTFITALAGTVAHEAGHTLGLDHQGNSKESYYWGHPIDSNGNFWNTMMGGGTYQPHAFLQFSYGDYIGANSQQDTLQVIATENGFGYRPDEGTQKLVFGGNTATANGIIATTGDYDDFTFTVSTPAYYSFHTASGIAIDGQQFSSLYYYADLYKGSQLLLHEFAPLDTLTMDTVSLRLDAGTYTFRIGGCGYEGQNGYQGFSAYGSLGTYTITTVFAALAPLTNIHLSSLSNQSVSLAWNAVNDASGYTVQYKKAAENSWTTASTGAATSVTINGLISSTKYDFRVQATNGSGSSDWAAYSAKTYGSLPTPNFRCTSHSTGSYTLAWDAVSGAASYTIEYLSGETWSPYTTSTSTSVSGTGSSGSTFTFRIRAVNGSTVSDWAELTVILTDKPSSPANFRSTAQTENSVTLNWDVQSGLTGYTLQYKESAATVWQTWSPLTSSATSATVTGLKANIAYQFQLTANNSHGSGSSAVHTATQVSSQTVTPVKPTAPGNLTAEVLPVSGGKLPVQINWNAASNATHYILHRWEEGDYKADGKTKNWKVIYAMKPAGQIPSGGALSDYQVFNSDVSKVTAKQVQYLVRGYNGDVPGESAYVFVTLNSTPAVPPTAPGNLTAAVLPMSGGKLPVQINWDAATNATHYILHRWEEGDYKADGKTKNWKVIYAMKPAGQIPSGGLLSDFQVINSDISKVTAKQVQYLVRGYNGDVPGESAFVFVTVN